jgi:pyruvyltransferase
MNQLNEIKYGYWMQLPGLQNFGDILIKYIFFKKTGNMIRHKKHCRDKNSTVLISIGSILNHAELFDCNLIIWGTGIILRDRHKHKYNNNHIFFKNNYTILSLRGPLTYELLKQCGYNNIPRIFGDPGLLLSKYYQPNINKKYKIGFIPHYRCSLDATNTYLQEINNDNVTLINLNIENNFNSIEDTINQIISCEYIISHSLHGIITAHSYNIKCIFGLVCPPNEKYNFFKYIDYYNSINLNGPIECVPILMKDIIMDEFNIDEIIPINFFEYKNFNIDDVIQLIEKYPNPQFPINTDPILDSCPF